MPIGEILSLGSAVIWGFSVSLFKIIGNSVSPYLLNPLKNTIGTILFLFIAILFGFNIPELTTNQYILIVASGIIGITIADVLFLVSLNILGTSISSIINTIYSPMVIMLAYFLLPDETLNALHLFGGMLIMGSIIYLSIKRDKRKIKNIKWGLTLGIIAYSLMALGIVIVKPVLTEFKDVSSALTWIILFRLIPGTLLSYVTMLVMLSKNDIINQLSNKKVWPVTILGSFLGTFVGFAMWIWGMAKIDASVASILNQTSTVFIAFFGWLILKEKFSDRMMFCFLVALLGAFIVVMA